MRNQSRVMAICAVALLVLVVGCSTAPAATPTAAPKAPSAATAAPKAPPAATSAPAASKEATPEYRFKFPSEGSDTHQMTIWANKFAESIGKLSNGRIKVEVFPNAQLGKDRELLEAIAMGAGTVEFVITAPQGIESWVPEVAVYDLPFLFRDEDHYRKFWDSDISRGMWKKAEEHNLKYLGSLLIGTAQITNNKRPINTPEDMVGVKFRVMQSKVIIETYKALGAMPVPMAFSELYMALQQGTVDGQENPTTTVRTMKFHEVQKYLSLTSHKLTSNAILVDKKVYDKLPPDLQKAVTDAAKEAEEYEWSFVKKDQADSLEFAKQKGMAVNTPPSVEPFRAKVKDIAKLMGVEAVAEKAKAVQ